MATKCSDPVVLAGLFLAAYSGNLADVKSLLKSNALSADVSDPNKGSTALLWACAGGSLEVVEWLVKQGGAKVGHRNKDDRTAFFFACEHCHKPVAKFLVNQAGVDVNAKDGPSGHSPLHRACIAGQTREKADSMDLILWLLTSAKADPKATDLSGLKPGEADLAKEAPSLKPSSRAVEIRKTLEDARAGKKSGVSVTPVTAQVPVLAPAPTPSSPARPTTTVASARAAATKSASPARLASPVRAATSVARPAPASPAHARAASPAKASPSRVAARAAALAEKTDPAPDAQPSLGMTRSSSNSSAPFSSVEGAEPPTMVEEMMHPVRVAAAPKRVASPTPVPSSPSPRSADPGSPWSQKPRAGGVLPRAGGGLPATANSARPGSPAAATAAAAAAVTFASTPPVPTPVTKPAPRQSLLRDSSYRLRTASASPGPAGAAPTSPVPVVRFQRPATASTGTTASSSATGSAAAVIKASNGPKASALAAAFENKAKGRDGTTSVPAPRRGNSGLSSAALPGRAPALASTSSGSSTGSGSGGGRLAPKGPSHRSAPSQASQVSKPPQITPDELLGKGSVMHRKQVYVAAAQKGSHGPKSPKAATAPFLGKDKKNKDGSFMDKFVSMFSISPHSSPASSPARSVSKSPRSRQKSPGISNGSAKANTEPARMGFFNTNKSFKWPDLSEKE